MNECWTKAQEDEKNSPGESLWWWVENKLDALLNVAFQSNLGCFEQLLLLGI